MALHSEEKLLTFDSTIRVRYAETDAMGIVHHSRYLVWLEVSRIEWLRSLGLDYKTMETEGYFIPVVEMHIQYKSPAFFDDNLTIRLEANPNDFRARFPLHYKIMREGTTLASAQSVHAFLNKERRLIKPPEFFLSRLSQ